VIEFVAYDVLKVAPIVGDKARHFNFSSKMRDSALIRRTIYQVGDLAVIPGAGKRRETAVLSGGKSFSVHSDRQVVLRSGCHNKLLQAASCVAPGADQWLCRLAAPRSD
jgi:hypothetical protein